jgi:hypothetical protein
VNVEAGGGGWFQAQCSPTSVGRFVVCVGSFRYVVVVVVSCGWSERWGKLVLGSRGDLVYYSTCYAVRANGEWRMALLCLFSNCCLLLPSL